MKTEPTPGPWSINDWPQEQKANAHLISAAPELHAELLKLADDLRSHTKDGLGATAETLAVWESRVLAAIAKATGSAA